MRAHVPFAGLVPLAWSQSVPVPPESAPRVLPGGLPTRVIRTPISRQSQGFARGIVVGPLQVPAWGSDGGARCRTQVVPGAALTRDKPGTPQPNAGGLSRLSRLSRVEIQKSHGECIPGRPSSYRLRLHRLSP